MVSPARRHGPRRPFLAAKPVIDVQISVRSLEPMSDYAVALERLGLVHRADNPELTKRYLREGPGQRRTHVHVRQLGSFPQQFPLLFRDYLRHQPDAAERYAARRLALADRFGVDRRGYVAAKEDVVWTIVREADRWARCTGWTAGPSDQ